MFSCLRGPTRFIWRWSLPDRFPFNHSTNNTWMVASKLDWIVILTTLEYKLINWITLDGKTSFPNVVIMISINHKITWKLSQAQDKLSYGYLLICLSGLPLVIKIQNVIYRRIRKIRQNQTRFYFKIAFIFKVLLNFDSNSYKNIAQDWPKTLKKGFL